MTVRVALVQRAVRRSTRPRTARASPSWPRAAPTSSCSPRCSRATSATPGSDLAAVRRAARRALRRRGWPAMAAEHGDHGRRRHVRGRRRPGPPVQHPGRRAARAAASYRKIHLYDSFGYRESDRLTAGPLGADRGRRSAGFRVGLMTCYDLRFPELARALVDAGADVLVVPAAWVAGDRARSSTGARWCRARAIENTVVRRRGRPARSALHRSLDGRRPPGRRRGRGRRGSPPCCEPRSTGASWPRPGEPTPRSPTVGCVTSPSRVQASPRSSSHSSTCPAASPGRAAHAAAAGDERRPIRPGCTASSTSCWCSPGLRRAWGLRGPLRPDVARRARAPWPSARRTARASPPGPVAGRRSSRRSPSSVGVAVAGARPRRPAPGPPS